MPPPKFPIRKPAIVVDINCSFRRPKLPPFLVSSTPKPKPTTTTTTSSSPATRKTKKKNKWVEDESLAVVKESSDPYVDFRDSMVQMIVEMEIYKWDDLRDLLHRFLALNRPHHHHLIVRAFAEIWNDLFLPLTAPASRAAAGDGGGAGECT